MIVGIAGYGKVGKGVASIVKEAAIYDPSYVEVRDDETDELSYQSIGVSWSTGATYTKLDNKEALNVDYLFICVPTPAKEDGSCDTSIVEEIIRDSRAKINIVRSTVWVGFTEWARKRYKKRVVFMPEYGPSDFPNHPFNDVSKIPWAIIGGLPNDTKEVSTLWQRYLYNIKIFQTDANTAEFIKLVENAYFYSKLTFFNQIYDIARENDINYDEVRLLLTEDFRIEADHSFIYPGNRKIGGSCLPKDLDNLISCAKKVDVGLLKLMKGLNEKRS